MGRFDANHFYEKFLAEAKEENGNFFFVRDCNMKLYKILCEAESHAVLDLRASGSGLRRALEVFVEEFPEYYGEAKKHSAVRKNKKITDIRSGDLYDYEKVFQKHNDPRVDTIRFGVIRIVGNAFCHEGQTGKPETYKSLCEGMENMQLLLKEYYQQRFHEHFMKNRIRAYDKDRQPYGNKLVCSVIETRDSTACEKQVLCYDPSEGHYYLLRIYKASDVSEGAIRGKKVLSKLWENIGLREPLVVNYSSLGVTYKGDDPKNEEKRIVSYDFGSIKPIPLHAGLIADLNDDQKLMVMRDIAAGVRVLHKAGIYHRNLQPDSVFVFSEPGSDFVRAKLVGFEYAKIDGDNATVFANVAKLVRNDQSSFFSVTMHQGLKNPQIGMRLDWSKEDIYSLGALFYYILTGKPLTGRFRPDNLNAGIDDGFRQLMGKMLSVNVSERPDIKAVMDQIYPKYARLMSKYEL